MVSISEARNIVSQKRQQVRQQQQQVDTARTQIQQTRLTGLSRQELQVRTIQDKLEREKQAQKLEGIKGQELKKLSPLQKDLDEARKEIDTFDTQVKVAEAAEAKQKVTESAFKKARDVFLSKDPRAIFRLDTNQERKFFKQLQAERETDIKEAIKKSKQELVQQGVKLENIKEITKKGELLPSQLKVIAPKALVERLRPTQTQIQKVSSAVKDFFISRGGEEAVAIGLKPFKKKVTGRQIRDFLRTRGLPGKVAGEFIPTRPQDVLLLVSLGGLISAGVPLISKGTVLGLQAFGALNALDTKKAPETRIAGTIVAVAPFFSTKKGDLPIFPKGKKGQAGRFQLLEDFFKKQDRKKADLDKVQTNLQFKQVGKKIVDKTTSEKIADIRKIFDKIKETKDPKLRKLQVDGAITFLERTYGRKGAQTLFRDFIEQETGGVLTPKQNTPNVFQKFVQKETVTLGKQKLSKAKVKEPEVFFVSSAEQAKQQEKQKDKVISAQADLLVEGQTFFQASKSAQKLAEETKTKQRAAQALFSALVSPQRSRLVTPAKLIKLRKKGIPLLKLPKGVESTDLIKAIQRLGKKNSVDIIVGMKLKRRKVIGKKLPPFRALKKAQKFVDKNIEASFLLKPTGKKSKIKDIKPFNASFKFRPSKVNPLFQVERRKFRLDSPTEVKQLKLFKGKVSKGFFPKVKKKKKKK